MTAAVVDRTTGQPRSRHPYALVEVVLAAGLCLVLALVLLPDPTAPLPELRLKPPSGDALLGRDQLGRDVLSRLVHAGALTVGLSLAATAVTAVAGTTAALLAGYRSDRWYAQALELAVQTLLAFPSLWLPLVLLAFFGSSYPVLLLALVLVSVPDYFWILHRDVRSLSARPFIEAARAVGFGTAHVVFRELLPALRRSVLLVALLNLRHTVLTLSTLSFLGLGPGVSTPTWGLMIAEGQQFFPTSWWLVTFPTLALLVVLVGAGLLARRLGRPVTPLPL